MPRLLALVFLFAASPLFAAEPGWKAGFAKARITPEKPMWMAGYASRTAPAEGTETDLYVRAMVLEAADGQRFVLVSLDLVGIDRNVSGIICRAIQEKHKLPRERVVLAVSHTHCGPVVASTLRPMYFFDDAQQKLVDEYTSQLPARILQAVNDAAAKVEPVTLAWGVGSAGFAVNRRENKEPEVPALKAFGKLRGPVDHDVPVLAARNAKGKLKGILFGYACHATVLSFQKWCADYPGFAASDLEASHPEAIALFIAGCGADQNPLPRRSVELAKNYGKQLATAVDAVLAKPMTPIASGSAAIYREIELPLQTLPDHDVLLADSTNADKFVASRAKYLLKKLDDGEMLPGTYPYPIQTWLLGNGPVMVFLGGEVVVDYALRLKKELGPGLWASGYTNDVMAYIPSARVLKEGGYEGGKAMIYYGLPSPWGSRVEELIVSEVEKQVKEAVTRK